MKSTNRVEAIGGAVPTNGAQSVIELRQPYRVAVTIQGVAPLFFNRWNVEAIQAKSEAKKGSKERKSDNLESMIYRDSKGEICIPTEYLRQSIIGAAKFQQDPRSYRKSANDLFKAGIVCISEFASLGVKTWDYVDKRRGVIQRSAITRSRPAFKEGWRATFQFAVALPEYIDSNLFNETVQLAGRVIGIGDQRPSYGRYNVLSFDVLD